MAVTFTTREADDIVVVDISGRITIGDSSTALHEMMRGLMDQGRMKIVLNLSGVSFMDSAGIGEMVRGYVSVSHARGKVRLCELTKRVSDLLQVTRLYSVLDIYQWEEDALEAFR